MTLAEAQILGNLAASYTDNWYSCMFNFLNDLNLKFPEFKFELLYQRQVNEFGGHWNVKVIENDLSRS